MSSAAGRAVSPTVSARLPASLVLALALIAAAGEARGVPRFVAAAAGAVVVFGGAALPWLVRRAPDESSALKLALFSALLSPPLLAGLWLAARLVATAEHAMTLAFALAALAQLLVGKRRISARLPARAELAALALGALLGGGTLALHLAAPGLRLFGDGVWHAARAQAFALGAADENPWMADTAAGAPSAYELMAAIVARALGVDAASALAWIAVWAAASIPIALYFLAAPLWREPRRALGAVVLALCGWNALGGLAWLARGRPALALLGGDVVPGSVLPAAPFELGWLAFALPGAAAPALAFALGGFVAAAHALRHARAPWVELCGVLHGLALLCDLELGLAGALATAVAAVIAPGSAAARPAVLLALALGALPAVALLGRDAAIGPYASQLAPPSAVAALFGLALLAAAAGLLLFADRERSPGADEHRPLRALCVASALIAPLVACSHSIPGGAPGAALALGGVGAALLAAGGLAAASARSVRGFAAFALACALVLGGGAALARGAGALARLSALAPSAAARDGRLEPVPRAAEHAVLETLELLRRNAGLPVAPEMALDADEVAAYAHLRAQAGDPGPRPILFLDAQRERQRLPISPWVHPAPLFSALPLWVDRSEPRARAQPECEARVQLGRELFAGDPRAIAALTRELGRAGRRAIVWVGAAERARVPGLDAALARAGFEPAFRAGALTLHAWSDPGPAGR